MVKKFWTITQRSEIEDVCTRYHIPQRVEDEIFKTIYILDENYGIGRDMEADGGYIALILHKCGCDSEEYRQLLSQYHLKEYNLEFSDKFEGQQSWCSDLYIVSNDFGIVILYQCDNEKERL